MLPPVPTLAPTSLWGHFINCFKRGNYARMEGRSSRAEYWGFHLFCYLITLLLILPVPVAGLLGGSLGAGLALLPLLGFILYSAMPAVAVYVRRLHDTGYSGYWIALNYGITALMFGLSWFFFISMLQEWLWEDFFFYTDSVESLRELAEMIDADMPTSRWPWLNFVSYANYALSLALFILTLWPGTEGDNRYGSRPPA